MPNLTVFQANNEEKFTGKHNIDDISLVLYVFSNKYLYKMY